MFEQLASRELLAADFGIRMEQPVESSTQDVSHPVSFFSPYLIGEAEEDGFGTGTGVVDQKVVGNGPIKECTLRAAMMQSNASGGFAIEIVADPATAGSGAGGVFRVNSDQDGSDNNLADGVCWTGRYYTSSVAKIVPLSPLPTIVKPTKITGSVNDNLTPKTEIVGTSAGVSNGFQIASGGSGTTINYLGINRFQLDGVLIQGASNNLLSGNFIGTDRTGTQAAPNLGNGVRINGGDRNVLGKDRWNVISANEKAGVSIQAGYDNAISVNYIGTTVGGLLPLGNLYGVQIDQAAGPNIIGGLGADLIRGLPAVAIRCEAIVTDANDVPIQTASNLCTNLISGNKLDGVMISGSNPQGSRISGAMIGTDRTGNTSIKNGQNGVRISGTQNVRIEGNRISGNNENGVMLENAPNAQLTNNSIGLNFWGTAKLQQQSQKEGLLVVDSPDASITNNTISGNTLNGVHLSGSKTLNARMFANSIGTDLAGEVAIGNGNDGIFIDNGSGQHTIGEGNLVSGNIHNGIRIYGGSQTRIYGSTIGTNKGKTHARPNSKNGILVEFHASDIWIGIDDTPQTGKMVSASHPPNTIAGNTWSGIYLDRWAKRITVAGNDIGGNAVHLGNGKDGITVLGSNNYVGTDGDGRMDESEGNRIQFNTQNGVQLTEHSAKGNRVAGNWIAYNVSNGVAIMSGANNNVVGNDGVGPEYRVKSNTIAWNKENGVYIRGSEQPFNTKFNRIAGNRIGTDGFSKTPNTLDGIRIEGGTQFNFIGTNGDGMGDSEEGNVISGNTLAGVRIQRASENYLAGNFIGLTALEAMLGNGKSGVIIDSWADTNYVGWYSSEPNVISGNQEDGVSFLGTNNIENKVTGNRIGTNKLGTLARPNLVGVRVNGPGSQNIFGNVISGNTKEGVVLEGNRSSSNKVVNNLIGTNASGNADLGNLSNGVLIDGSRGNLLDGNIISGNDRSGVKLTNSSVENVLVNNQIGIAKIIVSFNDLGEIIRTIVPLGNGSIANPGDGDGVFIEWSSQNNKIGRVDEGNNISGNLYNGIQLYDAHKNSIVGNTIGVQNAPNLLHGIRIKIGFDNSIGGVVQGEGNLISYNMGDGVWVESGKDNAILGNSIFENAELGIDLDLGGVSRNDADDKDTGANNLQNFPVLYKDSSPTLIKGILIGEKSLAGGSKKYRIEVFGSSTADPTGHGEGKVFVGATTVQWENGGSTLFSLIPSASYRFYSATATEIIGVGPTGNDIYGSTSEFGPSDGVTRIDFLDKNSIKTTYANVSKWENAFGGTPGTPAIQGPPFVPEVEAVPEAKPNFYKTDDDRVYVRIEDTARRGFGTIQSNINTIDLQDELADKVEQFDLNEFPINSGIFVSEPFVFVSNEVDDQFKAAGVVDGDRKDPTLNVFNPLKINPLDITTSPLDILLGGNIKVLYDKQSGKGPDSASNPLGLVDSKIDIGKDIKVVTLTTHLIAGSGVTQAELKENFARMNIAWAQANIRVIPDSQAFLIKPQPTGVDLTNNLDIIVDAKGVIKDTQEMKSLRANQSWFYDTIDYYIINDFTDGSVNAVTFDSERVIIAKKASLGDFNASAHELGHVLGLDHTPSFTIEGRVNVMYKYSGKPDSENAAKRLTNADVTTARSHSAVKSPLTLGFAPNSYSNQNSANLTTGQLESLVGAAIEILNQSGISEDQRLLLSSLRIEIRSLAGPHLGLASPREIWIDDDAAGWGWFVDPTPFDSSEFQPGNSSVVALDLLTVLLHEMGHAIGLEHTELEGDFMNASLVPGVRKLPQGEGLFISTRNAVDSKGINLMPDMFRAVDRESVRFPRSELDLVESKQTAWMEVGKNPMVNRFDQAAIGNQQLVAVASQPPLFRDKPKLSKTTLTRNLDERDDLAILDQCFVELAKDPMFAS